MYGNNVKDNSKISEVLYPFGFGLSYTQFSYGKLQIISEKVDPAGKVVVRVTVKNIGTFKGDEVVQLYVRDEKSSVLRPEKQLVGFERISLQPNESKTVELIFPVKDLAFWDVNKKTFVVEPGVFKVMAGSSSAAVKLTGQFTVIR
jgi:beta-glucosidase